VVAEGAAPAPRLIVAGNASVDLLLGPLAPWPTPGTETVVERIAWRVGGALGNTALALAGLGVPASLVWDVGDDAMGAWLAEALADAGDPPRVLAAPTSVTVALTHPDGERTFVSHLGHLATSDLAALSAAIDRAVPGDVVLVGGVFLLPRWRAGLPALLARARSRGLVTALDTGWPNEGWTHPVRAEVRAALPHVDLFLPNLEEARGLLGVADASPTFALEHLTALVAGRVAIKLGPDGAAYEHGGRIAVAPAPDLGVADTVGAGDTFNAGLLAALREGLAWPEAVGLAVTAASHAIARSPRRYPRWADLRVDRAARPLEGAAPR
jgi:sugar/nucleoside kinase (ribokinase family)